jgi:BlaI family transcriptional regulator, penicillinase repressor
MKNVREITPTELEILSRLWNRRSATIRELTDALYPDGGHAHYATVQSLLDRLEQKGCVTRAKQGRVNVFSATVTRAEVITGRLHELADSLCEGSLAPLLTHLVRDPRLSEEELAELASLVDRLERAEPGGEV